METAFAVADVGLRDLVPIAVAAVVAVMSVAMTLANASRAWVYRHALSTC